MDGKIKRLHYGDLIIELPYEIEYDKKIFKSDSFAQQATAMLWYAIKDIMEEIVKIKENKIEPLTEDQKKAKWSCSDEMYETAICTACDWNSKEPFDYILKHFNFCPNCGAKIEVTE